MATLLTFLAGALLVAGCGGGDPEDVTAPSPSPDVPTLAATPAPAPTAATTPAPTPTPTPVSPFADRALADEPAALGRQLAAAEAAVRDETVAGQALEDAAFVQQAAYRLFAAQPEWQAGARAEIPGALREAFEANLTAAVELRALTTPRSELPAWRIVEPAPAEELLDYYLEAEQASAAPWPYLAAIHLVETRMGRIRGTSVAGAQGPMQFMPATWAHWGEGDVNDNRDAVLAAGRYLRDHGAPGDMRRALFAYNRSDRYVDAVAAYARVMAADPRAYRGYHAWQVYYRTTDGDVLLEVGYDGAR